MRLKITLLSLCILVAAVAYLALTRQHSASTPQHNAGTQPVDTSKASTSAPSTAATAHGLSPVKRAQQHAKPAARGDAAVTVAVGDRWYRLMLSSPDRYTFIKEAAPAALKGDGRAAWLIGDALMDCIGDIVAVKRGEDPAEQLQQLLQQYAQVGNPEWMAEMQRQRFERCKKLATTDPFAGLPPHEGDYMRPRYWWDRGANSDDPGAQARGAVEKFVTGKASEAQAQAAIDKAVQSGDPMALFAVGFALSDLHWSSDTTRGNAIALAACELGYDCSADNPAMLIHTCKYSNDCGGITDFAEWLAANIGPDRYGEAYAQAQELKGYLARHQTDEAATFAKIYRQLTKEQQEQLQALLDAATP
jgi:hypothetical protein